MNKDYFPNKPYLNNNFNLSYPDVSQRNKAYSDLIEHFGKDTVDNNTDFQDDLLDVLHRTLYDQDNVYNNDDIIQMVKDAQRVRNGMRVERSRNGRERSRNGRERSRNGRERSRNGRERSRSRGGGTGAWVEVEPHDEQYRRRS